MLIRFKWAHHSLEKVAVNEEATQEREYRFVELYKVRGNVTLFMQVETRIMGTKDIDMNDHESYPNLT